MSSNLIVNNIEVGTGATVYTAASNQLTFGTNGTEKFRITSTGRVGINSTSPSHDLDVVSSSNAYIKILKSGSNPVYFGNANGEGVIETTGATFIKTGGYERLRINSSGNVGIGSIVPSGQLDVRGGGIHFGDSNMHTGSVSKLEYGGNTGVLDIKAHSTGGNTTIKFHTALSGTTGEKVSIDSSGTVDITGKLRIDIANGGTAGSGTAEGIFLRNTQETDNNCISIFGGADSYSAAASAINFVNVDHSANHGDISFDTRGSSYAERFRIKSGGDVEVKTGNLVIGTADKGIDFSAQTQSSSTTDDEILNHYEKGKWTPVLKKNNVANGTPDIVHGRYIRVGKLVWLSCYMKWNSGSNGQGTSGGWTLHGLPFALQDDDPGSCRIYQSSPIGYFTIDGVNYAHGHDSRWQINNSAYFDLYTDISSADLAWTTGLMIMELTGTFMLHE